ncbi:hypothetical protein ABVK25_008442 [Lepraria finkii]|uniref:Uncharacterized protein n=1 Tax=Lepraria finkii TaxID=1340010 RepID=A0ABR4B0W1_9LECA
MGDSLSHFSRDIATIYGSQDRTSSLPTTKSALIPHRTSPPNLCLNDHSYTGEDSSLSGYGPLFWAHFGGPKGSHLRHLTCISVTRLGELCGVEFKHDTNEL